ncbi:hypothetical protein B0H10DRAFT_2051717 [Mycena sp. CBHHK59/15]|nr:hypothetical protein B0H10DRAFT_2051717 [Mycena sp. CBHHK59/15]
MPTDSKSPSTTAGPSRTVHRTASIETLPQYISEEENRRRSLEDAAAPLPDGWFCHLDPHSNHHFYVDMNSTPPRSVWRHPRNDVNPADPPPPHTFGAETGPSTSTSPPKRGFMGKLKEKMIYTKADREAEERQKEERKKELLARYAKRREEVMTELQKNGGKTKFAGNEYVGPPASPYGGPYRALMPAPGMSQNLAGWLG